MGDKLARYRSQFQYSLADVAGSTGISEDSLQEIEQGRKRPSGDEILILADFYKCDYKFFLSNEKLASFEQTETLFRRFGQEFSKRDRWAVQECMYLAECEDYIEKQLNKRPAERFSFVKVGNFFKGHGKQAAMALRRHLGYASNKVSMNIYNDMRKIGIRVFRRRLENSNISGLYIKHPVAGQCVLVNYSEDVYRQRFTAAHETAHTILDDEEDVLVSFAWDKSDLKEVRANSFASAYLIPPETLSMLPNIGRWTEDKTIEWANKFKVSAHALAIALLENKIIDQSEYAAVSKARVPKKYKEDPELPSSLPPRSKDRKKMLLEHGLSDHYVSLCFEAYRAHHVSAPRLVEMLLLDSDVQLLEMANLYGESIRYGS